MMFWALLLVILFGGIFYIAESLRFYGIASAALLSMVATFSVTTVYAFTVLIF